MDSEIKLTEEQKSNLSKELRIPKRFFKETKRQPHYIISLIDATVILRNSFFGLPRKRQLELLRRIKKEQRACKKKIDFFAKLDAQARIDAKEWAKTINVEELMKGEVPVAIVPISSSGLTPPSINWKAWKEGRVIYGE